MPHSFSSRVTTAPDVMIRIVGDEAVLLNLKTELYLGLDPVGTRMWSVLHEAPSIQSAYEALHEVTAEQLRADMDTFLDQLVEQQLIEIVPQA
jgi:hypothetical protein